MIHAHTLLVSSSSQEHSCPTQIISSYLPAIPGCLLNWRDFKSMSMSVSCLLNWCQFENLTFKVNVLSLTRFWLHLKSLAVPGKHLDVQFHFFDLVFTPPQSQTQINLELSDLSTKRDCCDFKVIHLEESCGVEAGESIFGSGRDKRSDKNAILPSFDLLKTATFFRTSSS